MRKSKKILAVTLAAAMLVLNIIGFSIVKILLRASDAKY